eukprot:TRINITY_DN9299_c0_g1_i1.p1 TRINITY_DN9299_c0_g1~~TRINITY_DN9299_c0_g1_i1.p1  ORF type:complete len:117 (+),score=30.16 TRINITY_DN9299_c0_g1_i1:145-495(+)
MLWRGVGESGAVVVSRPVLTHLAAVLNDPDALEVEDMLALCKHILPLAKAKSMYYSAEEMGIAYILAECYQANGDYKSAAQTMARVDLETQHNKNLTAAQKCRWHVDTAMFFLGSW